MLMITSPVGISVLIIFALLGIQWLGKKNNDLVDKSYSLLIHNFLAMALFILGFNLVIDLIQIILSTSNTEYTGDQLGFFYFLAFVCWSLAAYVLYNWPIGSRFTNKA